MRDDVREESAVEQSKELDTGRLDLVNLLKQFGEGTDAVRAVDDINLTVSPGEFLTLLGPSGCGKTTTLRMIAGFENATSGEVLLDGKDMVSMSPNKRPMSMVFQSYALFPHLSVRDNVAYGLKLRRMPKAQMDEAVETMLASMNLTSMADRAPNQLSGGQQQRVALARALVVRPKVMLFDEPLSNLDAKLRVKMRTEIRRLQRRLGITSVYVTHDQSEAMALSDRIVVMNHGKIEQAAPPAQIYLRPASVFVADFVGRANFLDVEILSGQPDSSGRVLVKAMDTEAWVHAHRDALAADDRVLLVRPESTRVTKTEAQSGVGARGTILSAMFFGETIEYDIETDSGSVVSIVADPTADLILEEGQEVCVTFEPEKAWLLPAGPGATD